MSYRGGTVCWAGEQPPNRVFPLVVDDSNRDAITAVEQSVARVVPVVFFGAVGSGKTTLMREIDVRLRETETRPRLRDRCAWLDEPAWWTSAAGYVLDVQRGFSFADQFPDWSEDYSADGIAPRVQRLFLDDLGIERDANDTRFASQTIAQLLHARHAKRLPTWITTNLTREEFTSRYDERVYSRLQETSLLVRCQGGDRRSRMQPIALEASEVLA